MRSFGRLVYNNRYRAVPDGLCSSERMHRKPAVCGSCGMRAQAIAFPDDSTLLSATISAKLTETRFDIQISH